MNSHLWLIVLCNAILGWFLIAFMMRLIINKIIQNELLIKKMIFNHVIKEFESDNPLDRELEASDLGEELGPILDLHLNQIIQQVASQIPMGEYLVAGSLGQKLKLKIREEVFKVLPELKAHFVGRLSEMFDVKQILQDKIDGFDFKQLIKDMEKEGADVFCHLKGLGAAISALVGLLEVLLILLSSYF